MLKLKRMTKNYNLKTETFKLKLKLITQIYNFLLFAKN